jgi:outer membrane receptor protein involved in Fe transport
VGLRGDLPFGENWAFDASFTYSERDSQGRITDTKQQQMLLAANGLGGPNCDLVNGTAGVGGCQYWNPFFSAYFKPDGTRQDDPTLINTPELLNWMIGEVRSVAENKLTVFDMVFSGDLMELPAGTVGMAVGAQFRRDEVFFDADRDSNLNNYSFIYGAADYGAQEDVMAAFIEFAVPVTDRLELQVAGRMEDFEESDETTFDPKITAMFSATDSLTLRASAGTSFRVGSLLQRNGQSTALINIGDPFSGTGLAFRPQIGSGNPDLKPEESTAWNLGLSWAPQEGMLEGLSVDIDYYNYNYDDLITLEGPSDLIARDTALRCPQGLNNVDGDGIPNCGLQTDGTVVTIGEGIPNQVIRDPANLQFLRVAPTYSNAQELDVSGLDFTVSYQWELGNLGMLNTALMGSWAREWDLTRADGSVIDGIGSRNFGTTIGRSLPEWKFNLSLGWMKDRHSAFALVRYIDSYEDNQAIDDPSGNDGRFVCLGSCVRAFSIGLNSAIGETPEDLDRNISSWTTVDAQYSYELPAFGIQAEGSSVSIGGYNIFNRKPPRINFDGQFDPFVHDSRGAIWYARYTMKL